MPVAEIITIGTELLLGEIQDTNTRFLARGLRDAGVDLYRTMVVGDNIDRIAQAIQEALQRAQIVITTGGLGPTVDDPTRQAVAQAVGVPVEYRPELWEQITARFQRYGRPATENNRRQAYIPAGALPVENPVGTAPAFIVELPNQAIISLPGVPREMEFLFQERVLPYLRQRFLLRSIITARVLHTAGVGESWVDNLIGDLETGSNPTVGLLAHAGQVDIRVTAKADSKTAANELIESVVAILKARLGDAIYGADEITLEKVVAEALTALKLKLSVAECGLHGELVQRLEKGGSPLAQVLQLSDHCPDSDLKAKMSSLAEPSAALLVLGVSLQAGLEKQSLTLLLLQSGIFTEQTRSYGGPPSMSPAWAVTNALDFLRRNIIDHNQSLQ